MCSSGLAALICSAPTLIQSKGKSHCTLHATTLTSTYDLRRLKIVGKQNLPRPYDDGATEAPSCPSSSSTGRSTAAVSVSCCFAAMAVSQPRRPLLILGVHCMADNCPIPETVLQPPLERHINFDLLDKTIKHLDSMSAIRFCHLTSSQDFCRTVS